MRSFDIDPDIRAAATLPGWFYTDRDVFDRVRERVFASSWQFLCDDRGVRQPTDVQPVTLLEGLLDEPVVLTRDTGGTLHCLSNVCTHRGNLVACEPGRKPVLACNYHGRRFELDGKLKSAPEFESARAFPTERDDLPRVPLAGLDRFVFAGVRPAHPFEELVDALRARMSWFPLRELTFDSSRSKDYTVRANWALYCDNYLEGFHIPYLHSALNAAIDWSAYTTELFPRSSLQVALARDGEDAFDLPVDAHDRGDKQGRGGAHDGNAHDHGKRVAAFYWWLWPNLMLNFYPWGLSVNVVRPLDVDVTRVSFLAYVWKRELLDRGAGSGLERVEHEDEVAVEAVQRGVRSRLYDRGRYSPTREQGVHHFHRLLADALH